MQRVLGISLCLLCAQSVAWAQPSNVLGASNSPKSGMANNPLSRIGIGDLNYPSNSHTKGMGGIGTAYNNPFAINMLNPATYAFVRFTTFDISINALSNNIFVNDANIKSSTYTIGNLAFAIPLSKHVGMSFGFAPKSSMYYNANSVGYLPNNDTISNNYYGFGGLQNVYVGAAAKIKGFSIGANARYIFGNHRNSSSIETLNQRDMNTEYVAYNSVRGFQADFGALYQHVFNKKYYLHVGATYDIKANLNTYTDQYAMAYKYSVVQEKVTTSPVDTFHNLTQLDHKGTLVLPSTMSFGVHVGKSSYWNVGADFRHTTWTDFSFNDNRDNVAESTYRIGFGGEFTPNPEALENKFLNNTTFRLGGYLGTDYTIVGGEQMRYFGGTFGFGLPLFRSYGSNSKGIVNLSFDIGKSTNGEPTNATRFTNNYFKFNLGFNINDIWFQKRKFE